MGCQSSIELDGNHAVCFHKSKNKISDEMNMINSNCRNSKDIGMETYRSSYQTTARGSNASTVHEDQNNFFMHFRNSDVSGDIDHVDNMTTIFKYDYDVDFDDDDYSAVSANTSISTVNSPPIARFLTKKHRHVMSYIVSTWLGIDSIMCLDDVFTRNSITRPQWLDLLRNRVEIRNRWIAPIRVNNEIVEWIVKRQVNVQFIYSRTKCLQKMNLSKSTISDISLVRLLVNAPLLRHIDLYKCPNLSDVCVVILSTLCPKIQKIDNLSMTSFSTTNFESLAKCRDLKLLTSFSPSKKVILSENTKLNDIGVENLVSVCSSLQSLDLLNCINITDSSLIHLSEHCTILNDIRLSGCKLITDTGLSRLSQSVPNLVLLGLAGCVRLTDVGIIAIAKGCPKLKTIDISGCINLSTISIRALVEYCPALICVVYSAGSRISECELLLLSKKGCKFVHHS